MIRTSLVASFGARPPTIFAQEDPLADIVPTGLTASDWIHAGVVIAISLVAAVLVHRVVIRLVNAGSPTRGGVAHLLGRLSSIAVFLFGLVYALNSLGVRIGPLLGALGIVGIALAFALQDILENFIAGVILQARQPFHFGDQITSGDWEGTVESVNFRAVVIRTVDGTRVVLPSAMVLKDPIQNLTAFEQRRTSVTVGVAYGTDLRRALGVIRAAAAGAEGVSSDPEPEILVEELADSSVNFVVRFWHDPQIAAMWRARHGVLVAVYEALGAAEIEIPFPQRTLSFLDQSTGDSAAGATSAP